MFIARLDNAQIVAEMLLAVPPYIKDWNNIYLNKLRVGAILFLLHFLVFFFLC